MKHESSLPIFEIYSNIKFHENLSTRSRDAPCGQTDKTKLIVTYLNSAKAPKSCLTADVSQCTYTAKRQMIQQRLMVIFDRHFRSSVYNNLHSLTRFFSLKDANSV